MTEQELARCVVQYFERMPGWRLHQEVYAGTVADFVATNGTIVHVIEVKKTASLALLDQLIDWQGDAHFISAAVPAPKRSSRGGRAFRWALRQGGFGLFELRPKFLGDAWSQDACVETLQPKLCRRISKRVVSSLCEEQTTGEWAQAGSAGGGHYTPFKQTCREVRSFVKRNPGCTMKQIVDGIRHHYASNAGARSSLAQWIQEGVVEGVKRGEKGYVPSDD